MERVDFLHEIENKFWLVARAKNPLCATYAHESKEAAFEEAERLAKKENDRFLVLECVGYCETIPFEWCGLIPIRMCRAMLIFIIAPVQMLLIA